MIFSGKVFQIHPGRTGVFTAAGDKENMFVDTILEFVEGINKDEVIELFWDWANGLEESDFED